ncbi:MAG: neutral zinc metallopeptidase [Armatimonadetes bacterium]|nr:neutral zinc metallopeptidase [Armatimonadota bacterium]
MRWKGNRESDMIEDRRGISTGKAVGGGGVGILVIALVVMLLGGDPSQVLNAAQGSPTQQSSNYQPTAQDKEIKEFVGVVLGETEDVWTEVLPKVGKVYRKPKLVLFSGQVQSACGMASAAVGPFYCGEDETVYLDTSFFNEMSKRFNAAGDFARAYVVAHEVGHHVQKITGTLDKVHRAREQMDDAEYNALSVRLELQADFYAGVWAHYARKDLELNEEDVREAMVAADAIGDDKLQMQAQGYVVPDSFTHGTSEQRVRWFLKGWNSGSPSEGNTFQARQL